MTKTVFCAPLIAFGAAMLAYAQGAQPSKVGIINIQNAVVGTKDGQKAAAELQAKFDPRRKELEQSQGEIAGLRDKMQKGANTLSDEQKTQLAREIDTKTRALTRKQEDAQAEFEQEQQRLFNDLGGRVMAVVNKYASDNGFAVVIDVSQQNTPVLYAANSADITNEIIALYDKNAPAAGAAAPAAVAPRPVAPRPAAPAKK